MSLKFDLDLPAIEVRTCPNTDKALAYLSEPHALCEKNMVVQLKLVELKFTAWLYDSTQYEKPRSACDEVDRIVAEAGETWSKFLTVSLERYGETATINAQFLLGDPQLPPV